MSPGGIKLGQILTAMITPFTADGSAVDEEGASRLLEHLAASGSDGVVIAGTTGEAPTLTDDEQIALVELAVDQLDGRLTVIAGAGSNDTRHAVHLTERAATAGADAILSVTPYYNRPNEAGLHAHFSAVAGATDLPVILYNIPSRTGIDMPDELIAEIAARNPTVCAVKQARPGDPKPIAGIDLYAGNDDSFCAALDNGAVGGILVASHIVGHRMKQMAVDPAARHELDEGLTPLYEALSVTTNPIAIKCALALLDLPSGGLRLPLVACDDAQTQVVREALASVGLLGCD